MLYIILLVMAAFTAALFALVITTLVWLVCLVIHPWSWVVILSNMGLILFFVGFIGNLIYIIRSGLLKDMAIRQAESDSLNRGE